MQVSVGVRGKGITARAGRRGAALGLAVAGALALGGCETTISVSDINPFGSDPQTCPQVSALAEAARLVEFGRTDSTDETNIRYRAVILQNAFACTIEDSRVSGPITIAGTVEIGRKGKAGTITLPIFVALTYDETEVVDKRLDTIEVTLERGQTSAHFSKVIDGFSFELTSGTRSEEYELRSGFNLTPAQIDHNRELSGG